MKIDSARNDTRKLTFWFVTALALIAALVIAGVSLAQKELSTQGADAKVINLSGRQRMISQLIAKELLLLIHNKNKDELKQQRSKLADYASSWSAIQLALQNGDQSLKIPPPSKKVQHYFAEMEPYFDVIKIAISEVLAMELTSIDKLDISSRPVSIVLDASEKYLLWMDKTVFQYQKESEIKHADIQMRGTYILIAILVLLVLEFILIFRPMVRYVRATFNKMQKVNDNLKGEISIREMIEKSLRKKTELINMIQGIAISSNEASNVDDAMKTCIEKICAVTGWEVGHVYIPNREKMLIPKDIWFVSDWDKFKTFVDITMETEFTSGIGLPGRVLKSGEPAWIMNLENDKNFIRTEMAVDIGVKAGFAFPVLEGREVAAVLEFFTVKETPPDKYLLEAVENLSTLLGRMTERKRAENELKKYSETMEMALGRAGDVLDQLSKPPDPIPSFVTSDRYCTTLSIGGGDTIRWLNFLHRYAGLYLHDVSGHDIQSILLNILATALAEEHKEDVNNKTISSPAVFLNHMNNQLVKFCDETPDYVTAAYILIDFEKHELKLSLAGHPKPWLIHSKSPAVQIGERGLIMGQFDISEDGNDRYRDTSIQLSNGDLVLMYSDGLMEQASGSGVLFETKFKDEILPKFRGLRPDAAFELLKNEFESFLNGSNPDDDVSFIFLGSRPKEQVA